MPEIAELVVESEVKPFASFCTPPFTHFPAFGDLIHDENPLHRDSTYASNFGFSGAPVFGIALGALADVAIRDAQQGIFAELFPGDFVYAGYSLKFSEPVYENSKVQLTQGALTGNAFRCRAMRRGKQVFSAEVGLQQEYPIFGAPQGNSLIDYRQSIVPEDKVKFYELLGVQPRERVSPFQVAAQIPAALLELSRQKTGAVQGTSRGIELRFFGKPALGKYRTEIRLINAKGNAARGFIYSMHGVCYNDGRAIVEGSFTVLHPSDLR